jgi:hypothetical protein
MQETDIIRCNVCGALKKNVSDECIACREIFKIESPLPVSPMSPSTTLIQHSQIYGTPLEEYTMPLDNGKSIVVHVYGANKIIAYLKDIDGNHIRTEEFSDIAKFKETVQALKDQIHNEKAQLEAFKKVFSELGFVNIS